MALCTHAAELEDGRNGRLLRHQVFEPISIVQSKAWNGQLALSGSKEKSGTEPVWVWVFGGSGGFCHLAKVAVPKESVVPRSKNGLRNEVMTTHEGMTAHKPCKCLLSDDEVASWYANLKTNFLEHSRQGLRTRPIRISPRLRFL